MAFDKRKSLQNALAFTQQGKWDKAIAEYQSILKADPKDLTVCNNLGDLYARAGKLGDAIEQYLRLGELYRGDGLAVKAIAVYKKIVKLDPARIPAYLACADLYLEQGLVGEAKIQLMTVADLYAKAGDPAEVIKTYQRLGQLDAGNVGLLVKLGDLLLKQDRKDEAAVEYERAGQAAQASGRAAESKKLLQRARELAPQLAGPSLGDAELLVGEGKYAEAAAALERVTLSEPDSAEAWRLLGEAQVGAGRGAAGLAALQKAMELGVGEETLLRPLAAGLVLAEQYDEAVAICERVTEDALNRGEPEDAVAFCRSLLRPGQAAIPMRTYVTTLLMNLGRDDEARGEALELGAAHEAAGDAAAAASLYQQLVDRNPEDGEACARLEAVRPGGGPLPGLESFGLAAEDAAQLPTEPTAEPEITLEGIDDLAALLGEQPEAPAPAGEPEDSLEISAPASLAVPDGATLGEATIEFSLPGDDAQPLAPEPTTDAAPGFAALETLESAEPSQEAGELTGLPVAEDTPPDEAGADEGLGEFSALLREPSEDGVLALEPDESAAELMALAEAAAETETQGEDEAGGPAAIELVSSEEPIVLPSDIRAEEPPVEPEDSSLLGISPDALLGPEPIEPAEAFEAAPIEPTVADVGSVSTGSSPWSGMLAELEAEAEAAPSPPEPAVEAPVPDESTAQVDEQLAEAEVYLKYGLEDKARERLQEAVRIAPAALAPRVKLKEMCLERSQVDEACRQIAGIVELLVSADRREDAVRELGQGLALQPDHAELARWLDALGGPAILAAAGEAPPTLPEESAEVLPVSEGTTAGEILDLDAPRELAGLEFLETAEPVPVAPAEEPAALEIEPAEPAELGETLAIPADETPVAPAEEPAALEIEPAEPAVLAEPAELGETLVVAADAGIADTDTVEDLSAAEAAWHSLTAEAEVEAAPPPAEPPPALEVESSPPEPLPVGDLAAETMGVSAPEPLETVEIPAEVQALLEGPDAGPIVVLEEDRSERDQLLADDLAEAEFYLAQGMLDEARSVHRRLLAQHPSHPAVAEFGARLTPAAPPPPPATPAPERRSPPAPPPEPTSPAPAVSLQDVIPKFTVTGGGPVTGSDLPGGSFIDLGAELAEELAEEDRTDGADDEAGLVKDVLREFQRGVREQIADTDFETHYNLGVGYKDMELFDAAIEEFRIASRGTERRLECAELLGQCFLAKGQAEEAIRHLRSGLEVPGHPREAYHGLRYSLALAFDGQGDVERALEQLEVIQGEEPRFRDVASRVPLLRARLLKRTSPGQPPAPPTPPPSGARGGKKRISFI